MKPCFEEPYALMRARTGLWERGAGNSPSPPSQVGQVQFSRILGRSRFAATITGHDVGLSPSSHDHHQNTIRKNNITARLVRVG